MGDAKEIRREALELHRRGDLAAAERLYERILAESGADGETWHYLAVLRGQQARHAEALDCCRRALRHGYRNASVYANLGTAHRHLGDGTAALDAFAEAARIEPGDADAAFQYIDSLLAAGREREARQRLLDATARFPDDARFHTALGTLAAALNDGELAEAELRRAAALDRTSAESWTNLGNILQMRGRIADAESAYAKALALDPELDRCYWYLTQLRAIDPGERLERTILARAAESQRNPSPAILFAAARIHDRAGDVDSAFAAYSAGNARVRADHDYRIDEDLRRLAALKTSVVAGKSSRALPAAPPEAPKPVFIVGMPRAGSTLIEQMLARHPGIAAGGEIVWLQRHVRDALAARDLAFPQDQSLLDGDALCAVRDRYLSALSLRARGARFVTDKLPANFLSIPGIVRMFPDALIVHARRDAVETCWSCYRHLFSARQSFAYDLADLGLYHNACIDLVESCRARWPGNVVTLSHERLLADPEQRLRQVLAKLSLEWDERCLQPERSRDVLMTASALQVREGLFTAPRREAQRYRPHLRSLLESLGVAEKDR